MFSLPKGWPEMVLRLHQLPIRASLRYYTTGDQIKLYFDPCLQLVLVPEPLWFCNMSQKF